MTVALMLDSANDFVTSYCFIAGTLVTTEDRFKPIEEIEVGDKVWAYDTETGKTELKEVQIVADCHITVVLRK